MKPLELFKIVLMKEIYLNCRIKLCAYPDYTKKAYSFNVFFTVIKR